MTTRLRSLRPRVRVSPALAVLGAVVLSVAAAQSLQDGPKPAPQPSRPAGTALTVLERLPVRDAAPMTGYERAKFGRAWADVDRNGCDTRDDMLARDLIGEKVAGDGCKVLAGTLLDPYSGRRITWTRGYATASGPNGVDTDHVVALGNAWRSGAAALTPDRRLQLANDPLNLLSVSATLNRAKGDAGADEWLPPLRTAQCPYVARQIAVKARYGLAVTPEEHTAMRRVLARCPGEALP